MKKQFFAMAAALMALTASTVTTAFAGVWRTGAAPSDNRWWYDNEDGTWAESQWVWIDGNQDGVSECYAFDSEGWMYADTTTPDGYQVNGDGVWVVDGVIQTRNIETERTEPQEAGTLTAGDSRILVAYYTMPEAGGTDTDAGASRVASGGQIYGNSEYMAGVIAQATGGEMFRIDTIQTYPGLHEPLVAQASDEQERNYRPELSTHINNLNNYDVIFVGYPIWWSEMPMAMYSFFDEYNFSGKTVIPFSSHGGSGFSGTVSEITRLEPSANVLINGFSISRGNVAGSADSIRNWLEGLDLN